MKYNCLNLTKSNKFPSFPILFLICADTNKRKKEEWEYEINNKKDCYHCFSSICCTVNWWIPTNIKRLEKRESPAYGFHAKSGFKETRPGKRPAFGFIFGKQYDVYQ